MIAMKILNLHRRYVDDIIAPFRSPSHLEKFINLNSKHIYIIKFTYEKEGNKHPLFRTYNLRPGQPQPFLTIPTLITINS